MPQLQQIDTFLGQLIWLAISFVLLYVFLRKVALPRVGEVLDARQARIRADLDKAAKLRDEAEAVRESYEKALAEGRAEAQKTLRAATDAAKVAAAERLAEVAAGVARDIEAAEARIGAARRDALGNIRAIAGELAGDTVARFIGAKVDEKTARAAVAAVAQERE